MVLIFREVVAQYYRTVCYKIIEQIHFFAYFLDCRLYIMMSSIPSISIHEHTST